MIGKPVKRVFRIRNKANGRWLAIVVGGIVEVEDRAQAMTWKRYDQADAVAQTWERAWDDAPEICEPEVVEEVLP